jgi:hypothetical protein
MAKLLEIEVGASLLVTHRALNHDGRSTPAMLFETYFRADQYYYTVQIDKRAGKLAKGTAQRNDSAAPPLRSRNFMRTR